MVDEESMVGSMHDVVRASGRVPAWRENG